MSIYSCHINVLLRFISFKRESSTNPLHTLPGVWRASAWCWMLKPTAVNVRRDSEERCATSRRSPPAHARGCSVFTASVKRRRMERAVCASRDTLERAAIQVKITDGSEPMLVYIRGFFFNSSSKLIYNFPPCTEMHIYFKVVCTDKTRQKYNLHWQIYSLTMWENVLF